MLTASFALLQLKRCYVQIQPHSEILGVRALIGISLVAQMVKRLPTYSVGDPGLIPGLGRSSGEGNGNPLQYSCLENAVDGGAW